MSWQLLTILSVILISTSRLLQRVLLKNKDSDPIAYSIVFQFLVASIFFIYSLFKGFTLEGYDEYVMYIVIMGLLYVFANYFLFNAFKLSEASNVTLYFSTNVIWTFLAAGILLQETITLNKILGAILIFLAILILNFDKKLIKPSKGEIFAIISAIFFGIAFANDAFIIGTTRDLSSYLVIAFALPGLFTAILFPKHLENIKEVVNKTVFPRVLAFGIIYAASALTIFAAYQAGGEATVIGPINATSTILTVILAVIFLKEKEHLTKKILASIIAVIGAIIIGI